MSENMPFLERLEFVISCATLIVLVLLYVGATLWATIWLGMNVGWAWAIAFALFMTVIAGVASHVTGQRAEENLLKAIQMLLMAQTSAERKRIVKEHRYLLLSDEALQIFAISIWQAKDNPHATRTFEGHRDLLLRCRREGIDAAFAATEGTLSALVPVSSEQRPVTSEQ